MQSEYFIFDETKSSDMDIYIVNMSSSQAESPIRGSSSVRERKRTNGIAPTFLGVDRESIEFNVTIALMDSGMSFKEWTAQDKFNVSRWLFQDKYKSFQTSSDLGKVYYAVCVSSIDLISSNSKGYIELTFKTNSHCAWSPVYLEEFNLVNNAGTTTIQLENRSNVVDVYKPRLKIELEEDEIGVKLENISNGGKTISFTNLIKGERISIDNENRIVISASLGSNPFSKKNNEWLELVYGVNEIKVTGKCKIWVESQFPIMQ